MDGNQQVAEACLVRCPDQASALRSVVYGKALHAWLLLHVILKQPDAGGAGNAADQQLCLLTSLDWRHKGFLKHVVSQYPVWVVFGSGQISWRYRGSAP